MLAHSDPELDHGPRTERSATMRMCVVSREVRPIDELIRFVVSPQGDIVPDLKRKLPGRGMWITASRKAVAEAVRRHQFSKAFKRDLRIPPTLPLDTETLLVRSVAEALAISAKAGQVVAGFGKVESALRGGTVEVLIHASDGAPDGIRKLDTLARQNDGNRGTKPPIPIVTALKSAELDLALTRSNVIHAALLAGPASRTFLSRSQMLVRYRLADDDKTAENHGQDF
ncbi:RNA-binding protein [Bradyrhizobium neotropicale]|uniref:DNA-binding protein n=1 Tax=Bradyrhizobium neotropicale TaxID=1497615 RepID=A0A176YQ30_9BRAD|nr:RNA-binding protein [Bradyrhizobium neotropicale]OAF08939.1 DNA-binding protein [Bradyrhizobium neotropicale]